MAHAMLAAKEPFLADVADMLSPPRRRHRTIVAHGKVNASSIVDWVSNDRSKITPYGVKDIWKSRGRKTRGQKSREDPASSAMCMA